MTAPESSAPSIAGKRGRPGYDQRRILEIAVGLFNEQGYDATSVSMLADRLHLTKSALYHHFSSKDQLLDVALGEALDGLEGALQSAWATDVTAGERLTLVLRGAVEVLVDKLPFVTLLLRVRGNSEIERRALERRRIFDRELSRIMEEAQNEGSIRADVDARVASRLMFGMVNSIVEWYRPGGDERATDLGRDVLMLAMDGLRVGTDAKAGIDPTATT